MLEDDLTHHEGATDKTARPPPEVVEEARHILVRLCDVPHSEPVCDEQCTASVLAHLFESWRGRAKDPETEMFPWVVAGAPAGITMMPAPAGIFPVFENEEPEPHALLNTDIDAFRN